MTGALGIPANLSDSYFATGQQPALAETYALERHAAIELERRAVLPYRLRPAGIALSTPICTLAGTGRITTTVSLAQVELWRKLLIGMGVKMDAGAF